MIKMQPQDQETKQSWRRTFGISALLLTTLFACITYTVLLTLGFGDDYYTNRTINELRRFAFGFVMAFSMLALTSPFKPSGTINALIGFRILSALTAVVLTQHFFLPEVIIIDTFVQRPPLAPVYERLFAIVISFSVLATFVAIYQARFQATWTIALNLTMLAELFVFLQLMIVGRKPELLWRAYDTTRSYETAILAIGLISAIILFSLSLRDQKKLPGSLTSFSLLAIAIATKLYEWHLY